MQKNELRNTTEAGEPVVVVLLSPRGLDRAFVLYEDAEALEAGNLLLAKISAQLTLIDDALRGAAAVSAV